MNELSALREVLEKSIEKNGDKPLTLSHLVNIIKLLEKQEEAEEGSWPDDDQESLWK